MEKEFIPYEQALALKELGFNEECIMYYAEGHPEGYYLRSRENTLNNTHWMFTADDNKGRDKMCTAPLYQQALSWFREKHNLHSKVSWLPSFGEYWYSISSYDDCEIHDSNAGIDTKTYEESELACLNKLIELVKEK
jgi:hypothetical protein